MYICTDRKQLESLKKRTPQIRSLFLKTYASKRSLFLKRTTKSTIIKTYASTNIHTYMLKNLVEQTRNNDVQEHDADYEDK
jgi:hypothetical protein